MRASRPSRSTRPAAQRRWRSASRADAAIRLPPIEGAITYAEFGERFFAHAVTEERILGAVRGLAGEPFEFGPIGTGPAKLAKVRASGVIGEATCERLPGEKIDFRLLIPVTLELEIDLGVDRHRFDADVEVGLTLRARAAAPLRVVIEIEDPTWRDVDVDVRAGSMRASVLQVVSGMDREIRRFIARYVRRELDKPHIRKARDIDVAARIDGAWTR